MHKNFDEWNDRKKKINERIPISFARVRDIWWCSLGLNIGSEEDGKNELFERPILILKVLNKDMVRILPMTSKIIDDQNHNSITYNDQTGSVKFSQLKTISTKRLTRKLCRLDTIQFQKIAYNLRKTLI